MLQIDSATAAQFAAATTVAFVLAGTVLSGPAIGVIPLGPGAGESIGDGDARVSSVNVEYGEFRLSPGRFGTDVTYLRIPDAVVDVSSVTDRARLVYRVRVPDLNVERTATVQLTDGATGRHRIRLADRALDLDREQGRTYRGIVTVRVQSFTVDRTISNRTVRIGWDS